MSRRKRERETPEVAAGVRRMIRGLGRRVADADPVDLAEVLSLRAEVEQAVEVAIAGQLAAGFSLADVAEGLGVTKQAVHKRYGHLVPQRSVA